MQKKKTFYSKICDLYNEFHYFLNFSVTFLYFQWVLLIQQLDSSSEQNAISSALFSDISRDSNSISDFTTFSSLLNFIFCLHFKLSPYEWHKFPNIHTTISLQEYRKTNQDEYSKIYFFKTEKKLIYWVCLNIS